MKYGQIIRQSWQIVKQTRLFLLFVPIYFLGTNPFSKMGAPAQACLWDLLWLFSLFLYSFSEIGMIVCADGTIQGKTLTLKDVWNEYRNNIIRYSVIFMIISIPLIIIILCSGVYSRVNPHSSSWNSLVILKIFAPFYIGILNFCFFGLLLQKLNIGKSLIHGLSVFIMNWLKVSILILISQIPVFLFDIIILGKLYVEGMFTYSNYIQTISRFPVQLLTTALDSAVVIFSTIMLLLAYKQFTKEFNYPFLKTAVSKR